MALIHGFTQSGPSWDPVVAGLAADHAVVTVDAPGHGGSADVRADLWEGAALIGNAVGPATYVGYSMGGRLALHLALGRPDLVERLVLVSTSAGIDDDADRARRRADDEALARRIERDGVEAFVRWWLTRPLFATLPAEAAALDSRLGGDRNGLASSLRLAGAGTQAPLWDRLGELAMPVLVVAGELDAVYRAHARRLAATIGSGPAVALVAGAGHACHLERPAAFTEVLSAWLARTAR